MARAGLAALVLAALMLSGASAQAARGPAPVAHSGPPLNLKGFLLRASEPTVHVFPRTPSFAWTPVANALHYEFELAMSKSFAENAVIWSNSSLSSPVASIPIALPWITGNAHSLYAHVRALTRSGVTAWSAPFGFDVRWAGVAQPLPTSYPGLLRWTPLSGASQYNVWLVDVGKVFTTMTNVADEREYYSFHQDPVWTSVVHWRVRPERYLYGVTANGLPAISFGPWSPTYTSYNPPFSTGPLTPVAAVSDTVSNALAPKPHALMPGFAFTGNQSLFGGQSGLYRVYIATDRDCLNIVYRGAVVGSPAYAPRPTGPLALPKDPVSLTAAGSNYLADGDEGTTQMADGFSYPSTEVAAPGSGSGGTGGSSAPPSQSVRGAKVDLWDSDWPSGRYYWTVVPVNVVVTSASVHYQDAQLPQESCQAGRVLTFGKTSEPAVTAAAEPYASGLSPNGTLFSALGSKPKFYGAPLVAWQPALGADQYEVEYSRNSAFVGETKLQTYGTSATLPLSPGTWYYRVRGLNFSVPTKQQMSWSNPVTLLVTKPRFRVVR